MLGDMGVGKTCIVNRLLNDNFVKKAPTVGANYSTKEIVARPIHQDDPTKVKGAEKKQDNDGKWVMYFRNY